MVLELAISLAPTAAPNLADHLKNTGQLGKHKSGLGRKICRSMPFIVGYCPGNLSPLPLPPLLSTKVSLIVCSPWCAVSMPWCQTLSVTLQLLFPGPTSSTHILSGMSDLSAQLNAFKNKIRNGPLYTAPRRAVQTTPAVRLPEKVEKKRPKPESVVEAFKRQRIQSLNMGGSHLSTQLHLAVEYIKQQNAPVKVQRLQEHLNFDIHHTLLPLLKEIDRIKYDASAETLEYVSLHNIRSLDDLLNYLRLQPTFKGVSVKELRDGWSGCMEAISELESEGRILVLRTKKENSPRLIWANLGGDLGLVDEEFCEMWGGIKIPERDALYQALVDHHLKPAGADPMEVKRRPKQEEKKKKKARRGKVTNTHMKGILKDYSQMA